AREVAEGLGARPEPDGLYDVVIEAAGTEAALARCIELVAPRGTVASVGVYVGGPVALPWHTLFMREACVVPSLGYCRHESGREMEDAAGMLDDHPENVLAVINTGFPNDDSA